MYSAFPTNSTMMDQLPAARHALCPPIISEGMDFQELLKASREFVCAFADSFGAPHERKLAATKHLPTPWDFQLAWALRTGAAAFLAMLYALFDSTHTGYPWDWSTAEVLAPVIAFVVSSLNLGSGITVTIQALYGCTIGALLAIGVVQITLAFGPSQDPQSARDGLCFALFSAASLFFISRTEIALTSKKFCGAILVVSVFSVVNDRYHSIQWYAPLTSIVPCIIGCACGLLPLVCPSPALAGDEVVRRIRLQSEYIDLILEEQFLLVLRSEAAVMSHSELLLANIEENRVRIQALLPAMKVELLLHWRADGAAITEAAKFFDAQIPAIRGKQLALRGRTLTGRDKLSSAQVISLSGVAPAARKLIDSLAHMSTVFVGSMESQSGLGGGLLSNSRRHVDPPSDNITSAVSATAGAKSNFEKIYEAHRINMFYSRGIINRSHARFLRESLAPNAHPAARRSRSLSFKSGSSNTLTTGDAGSATLKLKPTITEARDPRPNSSPGGEEVDPFSASAEQLLKSKFGTSTTCAPVDATTTISKPKPPISEARDPRTNPSLFGADHYSFNKEHERRLSNIFFLIEHAQVCLSLVRGDDSCGENAKEVDGSGGEVDNEIDMEDGRTMPVGTAVRISLWSQVLFSVTQTLTLSGFAHGPASKEAFLSNVKQTLPLLISSALSFVPSIRALTPQSFWAALTVCFILTDDAKGVGASVAIAETRLLGTSLGAIFGLLVVSLIRDSVWPAFLVGLWGIVTGLFRGHPVKGYAAVCAGFTAALVIHGAVILGYAEGDDDYDLTAETLSLHRIELNFIGILSVLCVQLLFFPKSVRHLLIGSQVPILNGIGDGIAHAMAFFAPSRLPSDARDDPTSVSSSQTGSQLHARMFTERSSYRETQSSSEPPASSPVLLPAVENPKEGRSADSIQVDKEKEVHAGAIAKGVKEVILALGLLGPAGDEPTLWRKRFPQDRLAHVLATEAKCFEILSLLEDAAAAAGSSSDDLPLSVAPTMVAFSQEVKEAVAAAAFAWGGWKEDLQFSPVGDSSQSEAPPEIAHCDAFTSATNVAAPLLSLKSVTSKSILEQRDALMLRAFTTRNPLPQRATMGWMAVCFLCRELSTSLEELGVALREARVHGGH